MDKFCNIIKPIPLSVYRVNFLFRSIDSALTEFFNEYGGVNHTPDFQRGHVWTSKQQSHFIENILKGIVIDSGLTIQYNCPHFSSGSGYSGELPKEFQCIDGLQRFTAIRKFIRDELLVFGEFRCSDFVDTKYDVMKNSSYRIFLVVYELQTREELLQYYLDINTGGTIHNKNEIAKVRRMLYYEKDSKMKG
jgi:hypothetical protein